MIVFEPKRINQWQLSRFVPSGIIYGRMGRIMRNYGLRIIARPENKHSPLRRGRKSLPGSSDHGWWACRSSWRSLSWMPKNHPRVRLWNQRHDYWRACPLSQAEIAGRRQLPFGLLQISERTSQHNDSPDIRRNYLTALSAFQRFIHTGNIAEWTWRHAGGEENTYVFSYDGLSRLTDTRQYQAGERTDRFVERSLTYDRNGNILPLQRSQGDAVTTDFAYTYTGNRLVSLSDSRTAYPYAYDTNGNLVHDGVNGLDMTYNRLNLIEKVTRDGRLLANFSYLSNGRKYLMSSDDGHGLCYVGYW